ncbi:hypothetical protein [Caudoviricetes sp.]|nr:hypothetical protein [Caudoviricetes sp.]
MNTQTKHTPGPWYVTEPNRVEHSEFGMICTTRGDGFDAPANARLIAAAPELLDALVRLVNSPMVFNDDLDEESNGAFLNAVAAISKARGE